MILIPSSPFDTRSKRRYEGIDPGIFRPAFHSSFQPFMSLKPRRGGLAYRLLFYVLLSSSLITLASTALQLYTDYAHDLRLLEGRMQQIEQSYLPIIINSVWNADWQQLQVQLESILWLPDIEYLEVRAQSRVVAVGSPTSQNVLRREFHLSYYHRNKEVVLGSLYAVASLDRLYERLREKFLLILWTQGLKTFLVSSILLFVFQWLVTRHLKTMAAYARQLDTTTLEHGLKLHRSPRSPPPDELEEVAQAINFMRTNLHESYYLIHAELEKRRRTEEELRNYKDHLEEEVIKRTAELTAANIQLQREITERQRAEEQLQASLEEKEILLQEIHHRVKNNMQIVSSLLKFQSRYLKDPEDLALLRESQNRVQVMSLVHEKLYRSQDLASIDFGSFLRSLLSDLLASYGVSSERVALELEVGQIALGVQTAMPCGLIVNELVSNALKYAFPGGQSGKIRVALKESATGELELLVQDDGIGVPEELDLQRTESMGLKLVALLSKQLQGKWTLERQPGTTVRLVFQRRNV